MTNAEAVAYTSRPGVRDRIREMHERKLSARMIAIEIGITRDRTKMITAILRDIFGVTESKRIMCGECGDFKPDDHRTGCTRCGICKRTGARVERCSWCRVEGAQ